MIIYSIIIGTTILFIILLNLFIAIPLYGYDIVFVFKAIGLNILIVFLIDALIALKMCIRDRPFPQDPNVQLLEAVKAVFRSWDNPRANVYRRLNNIPYSWGTAVNVQSMVFGNMGEDSGTGVAFSRNPATGENVLYGEYLFNAQGLSLIHILSWLVKNLISYF